MTSRLPALIHLTALLVLAVNSAWVFASEDDLSNYLKNRAQPLEHPAQLDVLVAHAAQRKLVLLGESTHGTHEYYVWRDAITRRLVANHGFHFIAVEGDFPAIYDLNRYVKNLPGAQSSAREILTRFERFPAWMWGNEEFLALVEWLRTFNDQRPAGKKVGLYGMDVYNEWRAKADLLEFLATHDPDTHQLAVDHYACFAPHGRDSWRYARAVEAGEADCAQATLDVVNAVKNAQPRLGQLPDDGYFFALQSAKVKHNAEKFYRKSQTRRDSSAWNARASHMHDTVTRLLALYGDDARAVVWAHNSHIGDAHFTAMRGIGQHNIGQLSRRQWGADQVFLLGFSTLAGQVNAADHWGGAMAVKTIPTARSGSVENLLASTGLDLFYLVFDGHDRNHPELTKPRGNRAVGVVYRPENDERQYLNTILPLRYDGVIFIRHTRALAPLRQ